MKRTLYFIAAMTLAASSAMASKARVSALSSTPAITDLQGIFTNPADMHYVGDFVTFEMGETTGGPAAAADLLASTPNAEGGFVHAMGDAKFGFYLGKMSNSTNPARALATYAMNGNLTSAGFLQQENPFEIFYGAKAGDLNWGASFTYSNSDKKNTAVSTDDQKQSTMGVRMGVKTDEWAAYANVGLGSDAKLGEAKFSGKSAVTVGGHYMFDTMKAYLKYDAAGSKATDATGTSIWDQDYAETTIGFTNAWKNDGNIAFYGLAYKMKTEKYNEVGSLGSVTGFSSFADNLKIETTSLPFTMGAEMLATSWLTLRGSVTQNLLLGSKKTTVSGTGEADTLAHNTTTAAGAGFVWGHNTLDVVMKMGTNGNFDATTFGSDASYTYTF